MMPDTENLRSQFPGLRHAGPDRIFFDNPAGTQMSQRAISRMVSAMTEANANLGGFFETSVRAGELVSQARLAAAAFLNAPSPEEIVFGPSMTALTFSVSRALGRMVKPGSEILLTRMDHDANVAPWLQMAEERGLNVRWLDFDPESCEFDIAQLDGLLSERTFLAAINYASNVTGTINDVKTIAQRVRQAGGLTYVDAVQFAPHGVVDVQDLGCDFLVCSAYKFYGPHQALLWGRQDLLDSLPSQRVRPVADQAPGKWEMGTKSREAIAGVTGAIEHFAWMGEEFGQADPASPLRDRIVKGFAVSDRHERELAACLLEGLREHAKLRVHGLTASQTLHRRVPTVSFTVDGIKPAQIAAAMAKEQIFVWSGHNYGIEPVRRLGVAEDEGVLRVGLAHYNTRDEVDRFLAMLRKNLSELAH